MANQPNLPNLSASSSSSAGGASPASTSSGARATSATSTGDNTSSASSAVSSLTPTSASTTSVSIGGITGAPTLSTNGGNGPLQLSSGFPTLSGYYSYPPPSVPPTADAPFMRSSDLPQNFVFIVVGACLAFIALIIVLWRFMTAWSINRNFRRDTSAGAYAPLADTKRKITKQETSHDLSDLNAKLPSSFNSVPNLFFSPTAEVARQSMVRPTSQHMPAGHYRDASR